MKARLHLVLTVSRGFETYLADQPRRLSRDFDVTLIASPGPGLDQVGAAEGVRVRGVSMTRSISPWRDLRALVALFVIFRRDCPVIIQSYSPKAGLLAMVAGWAARVPVRVHGIIGMPLIEAHGVRAAILVCAERLTYAFATHLTCNSEVLRGWVYDHLSRRPIDVVGNGSVNGVDTTTFRPPRDDERREAREHLGLHSDNVVFAFVGRLVPDKGITELISAFSKLPSDCPTQLLLVGDDDGQRRRDVMDLIAVTPGVLHAGWHSDVRAAYWAADVLVLPSYREGMPNVLLEAGATGLPVIATDINGCNEVVVDGVNGILVPVRDVKALSAAMSQLCDARRREDMGSRSREPVVANFEHVAFCNEIALRYQGWLARSDHAGL